MNILKIARMGHPVLRSVAQEIEDPTAPAIRQLALDMVETMRDAGGVGLAGPQVHSSLRLFVYFVPEARVSDLPGDRAVPLSVLVNPVLEPLDETTVLGWEGCLSIPGLRGAVPRFQRIRYRGFDLDGKQVTGDAVGFHARVLQHENDHLDGVMYPERMTDHRLLTFTEEGDRYPIELPQAPVVHREATP
jgi:peptide deformylase